jgi:hypothetical protein
MTTTSRTHLSAAVVRLIERHGEVPSGALGRVVGRFARENPTYIVSFPVGGVIEVRGDEIVASA